MKAKEAKALIGELLAQIEEEDVGISLLSSFYQDQNELNFFDGNEREKVQRILGLLRDDSLRHKETLKRIIVRLEEYAREK